MKPVRHGIVLVFALLCILTVLPVSVVSAEENSSEEDSYLEEQMEQLDVDSLWDRLPKETADALQSYGIQNIDPNGITSVSTGDLLSGILQQFSGGIPTVLNGFFAALTVILICAIMKSMQLTPGEGMAGNILYLVGMLCIASSILPMILQCISQAAAVIHGGAYFMLGCIPILIALLIAGGKAASGASLGTLLLAFCNGISFLASSVLVPVLNLFLGFSLVSSLSPNLNLQGICKSVYSGMKWILGLGMTIFSALLTIQGLLGDSVQVTTNKTVKYVVSSFVPVVGTALGEAFGTVHNCAKLIRSGVGAFGILAVLLLFLPSLIQCVLWNLSLTMASGISDVFSLSEISAMLRAVAKVMSLLTAMLLCCVIMMVVVLEALMAMGGNV